MEIRPVTRADRKEWARMRVELYTDPPVREIDDWLEARDSGAHGAGIRSGGAADLFQEAAGVIRRCANE